MAEQSAAPAAGGDPRSHTAPVRDRIAHLVADLRAEIDAIDDPRGQALFETAAEVLGGLEHAFADYERRNESAWQE